MSDYINRRIVELRRLIDQGAYKGNEQQFDRLADAIRVEEQGAYYAKHPEAQHVHH